ncbi:MAG: phosphotransferase enzyme family protein, partial [Rheinheimera sp.]
FIDHGSSIEVVESPAQAYAAALTFGQFAAALADFDASSLVTVLPDFHNLSMRFSQLQTAIANNQAGRLADCQPLVDFCLAQQGLVAELAALVPSLPLRVCHNDTKINNMLYCAEQGRGIAAIDLDTCMSGYWMFDFGDMVRTCCSPEAEDSLNTDQVRIRPEIFAALAKGYLHGLSEVITDAERQSLLLGAKVMCLMIGIRFLADHLNGDKYFAIKREHHNLQRAHNQIRLYQDLLAQQQQLTACFA